MSETGASVLVLEKESEIGGLSRTLQREGYCLDFCAHRFHTNNQALLREILALPGLTMHRHVKKSRIYMFGKYLKYPFEIQNLLRAMPLEQSVVSAGSFAANYVQRALRKKPAIRTYRDWFVDLYGARLYDVMCYPYTSKIWRTDPSNISADWADQRFQGESMARLVKRILKKLITFDFSSYSIEDDSLAPDGGIFYYPERGIQELPNALAAFAKAHGAETLCNAVIRSVSRTEQTITFEHGDRQHTKRYGTLVSTIPVHTYYALQDLREQTAERALARLKYMDIIFVYAFVNRPNISNDHWLYFPDEDIIFNRAVEFSNWSPSMCPPGKTSVCFDITAFDDDERWRMSDQELAERVLDDADRVHYLERSAVESFLVHRVKYAYPVYDVDYAKQLETVVCFLEDEHSFLLGRTGIFRYNNSDNSIEMGFQLADNFKQGKKDKSVFEHRFRDVSL
jgi:protoporphyrinogen oxidase